MIAPSRARGPFLRCKPRLLFCEARRLGAISLLAVLVLQAGGCMNHYLIYPDRDPPGVVTRSQDATRGPLLMHLEWAQPSGPGPFPTVIVHPPGGGLATEMKGVIRDLARH